MPKGIQPPSAAYLGGLKRRHESPSRQVPGKTGNKTGNGENTTLPEATMESTQHTTHSDTTRPSDKNTQPSVWDKMQNKGTPALSKTALQDLNIVQAMDISDTEKEKLYVQIASRDLLEQTRWGRALDVLVVGGAIILVAGAGFVTLAFLSSLFAPAPMPQMQPAA
jgi:hypothetical protein